MSTILGETLTFAQEQGPEIRLFAFGDEHYHRIETPSGFTVVYDADRGRYCYAQLLGDRFVSSGVPADDTPPPALPRHLTEPLATRARLFQARRAARQVPASLGFTTPTLRTFGPEKGLLEGRRLSTGAVKGLTILVDFQDVVTTVTAAEVDAMLNSQGYSANGNACSVREYFAKMSSGKLDYTNRVVGPFTLARPRASYFANSPVREALELAVSAGVDLREFDSRAEGVLDALTVLYAGQTQYQGELWPHNSVLELDLGAMRTSFYVLTSVGRRASDMTIGTFCHESGHMLCRFPDLYDYGNRDRDGIESAGLAYYCLMSAGNHLDGGRTPAPVCAYLRDLAGWCDQLVDLNAGGRFEAVHGAYGTVMRYSTGAPNEYFLVENRSKIGLDAHLASSGLAVYHCDVLGSNEWQEGAAARHYQCALLQADGRLDLERNVNQGDGGDLFGATAGVAVAHATAPSSRLWGGSDSGLKIAAIGSPGQRIGFTVGEGSVISRIGGQAAPGLAIPDDSPAGVVSTIRIEDDVVVSQLAVKVQIEHPWSADLVVELVAPTGAVAVLQDRSGSGRDLARTWDTDGTPALAAFVGLRAAGNWMLRVVDAAIEDVGRLVRWSLEIGAGDPTRTVLQGKDEQARPIPDADATGVASAIRLQHPGTARRLTVEVDIQHSYIGDLRVELLSPRGRRATLHARLGGARDDLRSTWDSAAPGSPLATLVGEPISGDWLLRVADLERRDEGTLRKWSIAAVPSE